MTGKMPTDNVRILKKRVLFLIGLPTERALEIKLIFLLWGVPIHEPIIMTQRNGLF